MNFQGQSRAVFLALLLTLAGAVQAQVNQSGGKDKSQPLPAKSSAEDRAATLQPALFLKNLAVDQKTIWTSPFRARIEDMNWLVPMIGLSAGLMNADAELSSRIDSGGTFARHAGAISNAGIAAAVAGGGSLYLLGKIRSDDHQREAGILAGEAAINSVIVVEAIKLVSRRERPTDGNGQGRFFQNGSLLNSSFPSAHAIVGWSIASVVAHEYPGILTQTLGYGLAAGVSLARVYGQRHFTSDVVVGSAMGWLIGRQVYASHHRLDLPGGGWGTFHHDDTAPESPSWETHFSPYVPMDSWVYPALDRLAGLGVINSNFAGLKPWTRAECARLLEEAEGSIDEYSGDEGSRLYAALAREFKGELNGETAPYAQLDSVYARITGVSGDPLTDDYHFGRTIVNDFGRPFQKGGNGLGGFSASGSAGALGFYVRGEFEHAPSAPGFTQAVQDQIQITDQKPLVPSSSIPAFNQFRLLDTYISLNLKGWQTSFGKQTLWLSPTRDPFLWSDNAEPMYMLRVDQSTPKQLPSLLKYLGPVRTEFWVGKLTGQHFVNTQDGNIAVRLGRTLERQPMVNGIKFNFKPTPNFEFGVGRTGLFGGPDFPITLGSIRHDLFSTHNAQGRGEDPGDRRSTADFTYRLPGMRNWLTLYDDSFVEDEISPVGYPRRSAHNAGLYLSHVPLLDHMDMRVEGGYNNLPGLLQPPGGGFFNWNTRYLDGYTNKENILGNGTLGRQGISLRAETTYWFASDKTIQLGYRSNIADSMFLEGGNLRDIHLRSEWSFNRNMTLSSFLQYEWWNFPLLSAGNKQTNFTASFQVTYWPHWRFKRGS
ncbi:MAG TPA: capsule assembly Wzi family protein [Candidatus Limnocylindrales bacterium]|nr:capsule assembly Wzi family protein [Candidatus Limnocylindrales bacterium]